MKGWKTTNGSNGTVIDFVGTTIGLNGMTMDFNGQTLLWQHTIAHVYRHLLKHLKIYATVEKAPHWLQ